MCLEKPWPRPGFAGLELKDSGSEISQRPQCPPFKSHEGGLDTNVKMSVYKDGQLEGFRVNMIEAELWMSLKVPKQSISPILDQ